MGRLCKGLRKLNMEGGVTEAEGGVTEAEAGNMEAEGGITEAEAGNMEAEGGVTEAKAENMVVEERITEADGGVMEADLEEAMEAEGGITEPHLEEAADREEGVIEAKEVAREMEWRPQTLLDTLAVGDVFAMKADDEEMEYWLLQCTTRKHKIIENEVRCPWNTKHIFTRNKVVVYGKYFEFQKKLKGPKFIYMEAKKNLAIIYSHLVRAVKIKMASMPPMDKQQDIARFSIDNETHEQILAALSELEAPPFEKV
ncbi:hypothetical protein R1flu_011980 [Riccia fluitans]|uniref:Uncharacterized protein n=1 Tax=Riccia fluitans TaxID=41844 RepID=A0ABD1Z9J8_9MARC